MRAAFPWPCGLPQAHDARETLEITLSQPGAELTLFYTAFPTAIVRPDGADEHR